MTQKKKSSTRSRRPASKKGRGSSVSRANLASGYVSRFALPIAIIALLLGGIVFLGAMGLRTATASGFFGLRNIDVKGVERTSADDIRRLVAASAEKSGVWNADLSDLRTRIEKLPFVKTAAVAMVLPAGIRVSVTERIPAAIVHLAAGDFLVDNEGTVLSAAKANDKDFPFVLHGWDEAKTEKAAPDNLARLKIYRKMLDEWKPFDLASHVREVDLTNLREPVALVEDSGRTIPITLAKDNIGKSLKTAIEAVSGKGAKIKSVDADGSYPVLQYLEF